MRIYKRESVFMDGFITISAYDSTYEIKAKSDIVCSGKNDELTIQKAIDECVKQGKNIYFFNGTYVIDAFYDLKDNGPKCAVCFPNCKREISIIGQNLTYGKKGNGVVLYVTKEALDSVCDDTVDVLRTTWTDRGLGNGSTLKIENIQILLSHNQKPVRCIDLRRCDRPELKNVRLNATNRLLIV
jgi:hypothetical protein